MIRPEARYFVQVSQFAFLVTCFQSDSLDSMALPQVFSVCTPHPNIYIEDR